MSQVQKQHFYMAAIFIFIFDIAVFAILLLIWSCVQAVLS